MSNLRRLSRIFQPQQKEEKQKKHELGPRISFELIKINSRGVRQTRTLMISEDGISNMKGRTCQWFYPSSDVYSVEKHPKDPNKIILCVIKRYQFEANSPNEANKIIQVVKEFHKEGNKRDVSSSKDKISVDDFELIRIIGRGSFSRVVLVRKKDTNQLMAMKVLQKSELKKRNQVEHTNTEKQILSKYSHPFIVKMYYSFQSVDKLYMCLEYVSGGELFFHLKRARRFPENLAAFYAAEVVLALEFLHSHDIIYRDLKPENILVSSDGHLKLTDFGLSKTGITSIGGTGVGNKTRTFCGTPDYLAPEIINGLPHGKAVDWWGLGILLYEMLTGQPPFKGQTRNELYEQTLKGDIIFPEHVSPEARKIVLALLVKTPEERLGSKGASEVKNHEFFKKHNIDWVKLLNKEIDPPFKPIVTGNMNTVINPDPNLRLDTTIMPGIGSTNIISPSFKNFSYQNESLQHQSPE